MYFSFGFCAVARPAGTGSSSAGSSTGSLSDHRSTVIYITRPVPAITGSKVKKVKEGQFSASTKEDGEVK